MVSGCDGQKPCVWKCAVPCLDSYINAIRCDGRLLEQVEETHLKQICMWPNSSWANQRLSFVWLVSCLPSFEGLGESGQTLCILAEGKRCENPSHAQWFHLIQLIYIDSHLTIICRSIFASMKSKYLPNLSRPSSSIFIACRCSFKNHRPWCQRSAHPVNHEKPLGRAKVSLPNGATFQGVTWINKYHQRTRLYKTITKSQVPDCPS